MIQDHLGLNELTRLVQKLVDDEVDLLSCYLEHILVASVGEIPSDIKG